MKKGYFQIKKGWGHNVNFGRSIFICPCKDTHTGISNLGGGAL